MSPAKWALSLDQIRVKNSAKTFFAVRGGFGFDYPVLSKTHREEIAAAVTTAIEKSGGSTGIADAPSLEIDLQEFSLVYDFTGSPDISTGRVLLDGKVTWADASQLRVTGEGFTQEQFFLSVIPASVAEPQMSTTLSLAISDLISDPGTRGADARSGVGTSAGTCFAISPDGWLVTANHVVENSDDIEVVIDKLAIPATVVARDREHDIALIRVGIPLPEFLSLESQAEVNLGDPVYTLGYPLQGILTRDVRYNDGTISSSSALQAGDGRFQISVPTHPGNSGGPLLSSEGLVVGVVVSRAADIAFFEETGSLPENMSFSVSSSHVAELMEAASVPQPEQKPKDVSQSRKAVFPLLAR